MSRRSGRTRFPIAAGVGVLFLLSCLMIGAGCGKKGAPLPPEPRGPQLPSHLVVRQTGEAIEVHFTVPEPRGEGAAQQPVRAELIRVGYQSDTPPPADPEAFRRRGEVVGSVEGDPLPVGLRSSVRDGSLAQLEGNGVGWTLRYAIRVRDGRGRSSPVMVATDLVKLASAAAPGTIDGEPTADGIRLSWTALAGVEDPMFNLYRARAGDPTPETPLNAAPLDISEYVDGDIVMGREYVYVVRLVLAGGLPYREGESGEPFRILAEDRFAPAAPGGIVVVQEGMAVRLFWNPNEERDLGAYRVYRGVDGGPFDRLTERWEQSTYLDSDVRAGQRIVYRVTAVDRAEPPNESGPSEEISIEVAADPAGGSP